MVMVMSAPCRFFFLGDFRDEGFGRQEQRGDACGVAECCFDDFGWVDDTGFDHVDIFVGIGIVAFVFIFELTNAIDDNGAIETGVVGDGAKRIVQDVSDDTNA